MNTIKIRWVLAHEPLSLFLRAAKFFAKSIQEKVDTVDIDIEIMTLKEYAERYNEGVPVTKHDLLDLINQDKIEMSQMYTSWLAEKFNQDMHVLDLPFLFDDHQHAQNVLEGEIGQTLLAGLNKNSNVRGLSFTYSGGFRMVPSSRSLRKIEDFAGQKLRSNKNRYAMETFSAIGATPVALEVEDVAAEMASNRIVAGESAWPRVYPLQQHKAATSMADTRHSLFLTSMIIRQNFWDGLDSDIQVAMESAAIDAARMERQESIDDGERARAQAKQDGIEIVEWSETERSRFKEATNYIYEKFASDFSPGLIEKIKKA